MGIKLLYLINQTGLQYTEPLIILDKIYYPDINEIVKLQPSEIVEIDVISSSYYYGSSIFNGIVRITTTLGVLDNIKLPKNGVFF